MNDRSSHEGELRGWKSIADYLDITVRAAQLWEDERGLPVRRFPGKRGAVYAITTELDAWKNSRPPPALSPDAKPPGPVKPPDAGWKSPVSLLLGVGLAAILLWVALAMRSHRETGLDPAITPVPLTSDPRMEFGPDHSPDGETIAFVADDANGEPALYVQPVSGGPRAKIADGIVRESFPCWSPDGDTLAFLRAIDGELDLVLLSISTGRERSLMRLPGAGPAPNIIERLWMAWTADGEHVAVSNRPSVSDPFRIVLVSVESGDRKPLTNPPKGIPGDSQAAFSPDGNFVAFARYSTWSEADLFVMPAAGGDAQRLTSDHSRILGLAWTPDSQALVFASPRATGRTAIHLLPLKGGEPRTLVAGEANPQYPSISALPGNKKMRLVYQERKRNANIWGIDLAAAAEPHCIVESTWPENSPALSFDGRRLGFTSRRSGTREVWARDLDGGTEVQLTALHGPFADSLRWSPDGRRIAFTSESGGNRDIFAVDVALRETQRVTSHASEEGRASWSRDGEWIYFRSGRSGTPQIWKKRVAGQHETVQVTTGGGYEAFESPDGSQLFYIKARELPELWTVPVDGGPEEFLLGGVWESRWAVSNESIYFLAGRDINGYDLRSRQTRLVHSIAPGKELVPSLAASLDGNLILWVQVDEDTADLRQADIDISALRRR